MQHENEHKALQQLVRAARRRLFLNGAGKGVALAALSVLPLAALLVAASQRWGIPALATYAGAGALLAFVMAAFAAGWRNQGRRVHPALALDEGAQLKDRLSSACEFLGQPTLGEPEQTQIRDALRHAAGLDCGRVLRFQWPRYSAALPVVLVAFVASFLVPPLVPATKAGLAQDPVKAAQLEQLAELSQDLASKSETPEELRDVIAKLQELRERFERGEVGEREVMLELGRMDEALRAQIAQSGVENLASELETVVPHLAANAASSPLAQSLRQEKFEKAQQDLAALAEQVEKQQIPAEELKKLAAQMGTASSKLGKKKSDASFSGDLAEASKCLEGSDCEGFKSACNSMGKKLGLLAKGNSLKSACNKLGLCKAGLGQCSSKELGYREGPKTESKTKGGLKAGTGASGDPLGDPSRLKAGYQQMLQIAGQAGRGPVESETETTEGQMSESSAAARKIHAEYAAVAEEVIESEEIPLSRRHHVKRYFQAIRPAE